MQKAFKTRRNAPPAIYRATFWVIVFAVAFALIESSVVIYLREIYYEGEFSFPVISSWKDNEIVLDHLVCVELARELGTIVMLIALGQAAGRNPWQKFCLFMIAFGAWDIFYYVWLRILAGWPQGLFTWDLLFLLPLPWTGPVLAPILVSLAMIGAGLVIVHYGEPGEYIRAKWYDWIVESGCAILIIISFCWDWKNIVQHPSMPASTGIPNPFAWWLFAPAYIVSVIYFITRFRACLRTGFSIKGPASQDPL